MVGYEVAFTEGNIIFRHLGNIDQNANPQFYTANYEQPHLEDFDSQREGEGEEESPLPILDPLGTHTRNPNSEHRSREQSSESMSNRLERHFGTIIEDTF